MHYLDEGRGDPVVMVHGNPTWSFHFRALVHALRERFRCIVPDHVGMGLSDRPPESAYAYTLRSRVEDLGALLAHLGVEERVTLVLHDWGGMIGMGWAARNPERVARIVAMNTALGPIPGKPLPRELRWIRDSPLGPLLVRGLNLFVGGALRRCVVRPLAPAVAEAYRRPYASWAARRAVLRFVQDIPLGPGDPAWPVVQEVEAALPRLAATPTLLCWGMKDFVFDADFLAQWTRRFPAAEVRRFEDAGHWVLEDAAADVVAAVQGFLGKHPLAGGAA